MLSHDLIVSRYIKQNSFIPVLIIFQVYSLSSPLTIY